MLCLLGQPALFEAGSHQTLQIRPKELALLTRLALASGPRSRGGLAEWIFPDSADPRGSLRWHLSHLRAQLPEAVANCFDVRRAEIQIDIATDVVAFRKGAQRILRDPSTSQAVSILELYRGDLCTGLSVKASADFDNWLYVQEDELRRLFRRAVLAVAEIRETDSAAALLRLTQVDPYCEAGHVRLIRAHEARGEADAARYAYDRYQRIVRGELHAEPDGGVARRYELGAGGAGRRPLPRDELVQLRDVTIHVVDWPGGAPPLLAVHGSLGHAWVLNGLGDLLAPANRFVAVDLRGHGYSDKPPSGYELADHLDDLRQLIEVMELERPLLLGFSIGGAIATFLAADPRIRASGLVLYDGVVGDRPFVESASMVVEEFGPQLERRFTGFDEYLEGWDLSGSGDQWERWVEQSARHSLSRRSDGTYRLRGLRQALEREWESVANSDSLAALRRVNCPVLVVSAPANWVGGRPYIDESAIRAQLTAARNSRLVIAHGSTHSDLVRRPDRDVLREITAFARSCAVQPRSAA